MQPAQLLQILHLAENLKTATRHSWLSNGRRESVAEHSWRAALFACLLAPEFPGVDQEKLIKMCLFHDMGEAFTGDIPVFEKNESHEQAEAQALARWTASLPAPWDTELAALFQELEEGESLEARLCHAIDKLEVVIQHDEAPLSSWIELEYTLNLTHGNRQVAFSDYLRQLKAEIDAETRQKIAAGTPTHP